MTKKNKSTSAACQQYRMDQPDICQVSHLLIPDRDVARWMSNVKINQRHVHHVMGRHTVYQDLWCNLLVVEKAAHDWTHDVSPHCGRLACLFAKWKYGQEQERFAETTGTIIAPQYRHWYLPALDALAKPKHDLLGAVSAMTNGVHGIFADYREQLLDVLES